MFFDNLKGAGLMSLINDPRLKDLLVKREFRICEDELRAELLREADREEFQELDLALADGSLQISGKVRKKPLPFAIPFSARFSLHSMEFVPRRKVLYLNVDEIRPLDLEWLTKKLVEKTPFLSLEQNLVTVDLAKIPRLAPILTTQLGLFRPFDHVVLKELEFRTAEIVGKIGVLL
jgi:hypothetical protein